MGLWVPAALTFAPGVGATEADDGLEASTAWLILPLCGPDGISAVLVPAVAAAVVALGGLVAAATSRKAWPWLVAAWLAPWVHHAVFGQLSAAYTC